MTAEIGILNPMGVALAADSAVTISTAATPGGRTKIYNSANKLFSLSKFHPIGIMVYGNATLMGFPWETIIKVYRQRLSNQKFDHLNSYCEHFLRFVETSIISEDLQKLHVRSDFDTYLKLLIQESTGKIEEAIETSEKESISEEESLKIFQSVLDKNLKQWRSKEDVPSFDKNFIEELGSKYKSTFEEIIELNFQSYPLTERDKEKLLEIGVNLFVKHVFPAGISGVVIAGFGEKDFFPSLRSFNVERVVNNRLKYILVENEDISLTDGGTSAAVIPFAQQEMVETFIGGIDPLLSNLYNNYLRRIFNDYPNVVAEAIASMLQIDDGLNQTLKDRLAEASKKLFETFQERVSAFQRQRLIDPILGMTAHLPKDELAAMAEALVNLTSFKRRISTSDETVGGPIDVAIISKGDGFIWVKRKHYFRPELNRHFFDNYFRGLEGETKYEQEEEQ
jgi:hypothetical protein